MRSKFIFLLALLVAIIAFTKFSSAQDAVTYSLTVKVDKLINSTGVVQFSLYNKDGSIPDEDLKNYYRTKTGKINNASSSITFNNLPRGRYAVNIFHDENFNGKIDKGFIMPIEGVGFTNYKSIGFSNRPDFGGASFELNSNMKKSIHVIYF